MHVSEPRRWRLDLRFPLLGAPVRVHPFFWLSAAALGWGIYANPADTRPAALRLAVLLLWVVCLFVSLLLHELGHIVAARSFGLRPESVLYGLGTLTLGLGGLKARWQRVVVLLAGPLASWAVFGLLWLLTYAPLPQFIVQRPGAPEMLGSMMNFLLWINAVWGTLNLLPVWPLDGGRITAELCEAALGDQAAPVALGVCLFATGLLGYLVWHGVQAEFPFGFDPQGQVRMTMKFILLVFCVLFLGSALRTLHVEAQRLQRQNRNAAAKR